MPATESVVLQQSLVSLSERVAQLGVRLSQAATAVQSTGILPAKTLIDEITASRSLFAELCAKGIALADALALFPAPKPEAITSLGDLKLLLQTLTQAEEKRRIHRELSQRAVATLDRLYAIKHRDREVFAPLAECQMRGTVLRNAIVETPWPKLHPSVEELAREDNPFVALLIMVEQGDRLDDDHCARLQEIVERAFSKALAIAALRQRLALLSDIEPVVEIRPANPVPSPSVSENIAASVSKKMSMESPRSPLGLGGEGATEGEKLPPASMDMRQPNPEPKPVVPPAYEMIRTAQEVSDENHLSLSVDAGPDVRDLKGESAVMPSPVFARMVPELQEVHSGSSATGLATEAASGLTIPSVPPAVELSETPAPLPPVTMNRADRPTGAKGNGTVDVLYRFEAEDKAQKIASLLLTGAYGVVEEKPAFLRDLIWRLIFEEKLGHAFHVARCLEVQYPEFYPRVPSWLLRAIILGQRVRNPQGEIARILKDDFSRCDVDCRTTGDKDWDLAIEFLLLAGSFVPALLTPETRASTVVHGVCLGTGLENLSLYCGVIALYGDLLIPLDPMVFKKLGRPQTKESIGFMRRLIGNQEVAGRRDVVSEQAEPLRIEIINRHQQVMDEINLFKSSQSSIAVLGSLACCRRAVEQVALLFDSEAAFSLDEPLPRPLLNGDLSRIPTLHLNKQGEPEGIEQAAFLENVLRLVASGSLKML